MKAQELMDAIFKFHDELETVVGRQIEYDDIKVFDKELSYTLSSENARRDEFVFIKADIQKPTTFIIEADVRTFNIVINEKTK